MSETVTTALQVAVLPLKSVTVSVTLLVPRLAQVKVEGLTARVMLPQSSELPLLIMAGVTVTFPVASRFTVAGLHNAVGGVDSVTGMVTEAVLSSVFASGGVLIVVAELITEGIELQVGTTVITFCTVLIPLPNFVKVPIFQS